MNLGFQLFTTFEAFNYLLHLDYFASRTLTAPRKFLTSCLSRQPCVTVDDSNMAGRTSEFQIQCKHFFQLFCNCLIISEKNFNLGWLAIHGLHWPTLDNWNKMSKMCTISYTFVR